MRILLRRVLSRVRQVYMAIGKKLAEVIRDESTSFVRPHDCRLVLLNETHLGRNIGDELRNGRRSDGSSHKAVRPNTSVPAACVDSAAVTTVLIEHTLDKWSSKIHVDERTRGRLWTTRDCFIERSSSRPWQESGPLAVHRLAGLPFLCVHGRTGRRRLARERPAGSPQEARRIADLICAWPYSGRRRLQE